MDITILITVLLCSNTVEKYLINLQLRLPSAGFQNIVWHTNAVIKIVYIMYSKRIYLARSLSIAATKSVDCSFIEAEHSTQVSN